MTLLHSDCRYWLAREKDLRQVELVDGCHGSPEGVAQAIKLMHRIFGDEGPWLMVEIHPAPDAGAAEINEGAAADCAALVQGRPLPDGSERTS